MEQWYGCVGFFLLFGGGFFLVPVMKEKSPLDTDAPISFSVWFPKLSRTCLICFVIVAGFFLLFFLTLSYCCVYLTSLTNSLLKMWVGFLVGIKMKSSTVNWKNTPEVHSKSLCRCKDKRQLEIVCLAYPGLNYILQRLSVETHVMGQLST